MGEQSQDTIGVAVATEPSAARSRPWLRAVVVGLLAIGVALLLGWILSGLPGVGSQHIVGVVLLIAALASGVLTLAFVASALRKARTRKQVQRRELAIVVGAGIVTGVISIVQLMLTFEQLAPR
jgi:uncharacterized membrane protein